MDVSELPKLIQKTWSAIIPPLFEAAGVVLMTWAVIGMPPISIGTVFGVAPKQLMPSSEMKELLSFYGLSTVLPIAIFVTMIGISQLVGRIVRILGGRMPPHLAQNITNAFLQATDVEMLRRLWVCHPELKGVDGLNALRMLVDEMVLKAKTDSNAHHRLRQRVYDRNRFDSYYDRFIFIKGLGVWSVVSWICLPIFGIGQHRFGTLLCVLVVLSLLLVVSLYRLIDFSMNSDRFDVLAYIDARSVDLPSTEESKLGDYDSDFERIELARKADGKQIWSMHITLPRGSSAAREQLMGLLGKFKKHKQGRAAFGWSRKKIVLTPVLGRRLFFR